MIVFDRKNKKFYKEKQYKGDILEFFYKTIVGKIFLNIVTKPIFSKIYCLYYNTYFSRKNILKFIRKHRINMAEFEKVNYKTFNDFFTRKKKSEFLPNVKEKDFISPADSKLIVYEINKDLKLLIKGHIYTIDEILQDEELAQQFADGLCLVFRLSVDDYHRYCYVADGLVKKSKSIDGLLHTVSDISKKHRIYAKNRRKYQVIEGENGIVVQMEVGAMLVGKIINYGNKVAKKGYEKGYFSFGGSTIVVFVQKDRAKIDDDIIQNSRDNIQTKVGYGEKIGEFL